MRDMFCPKRRILAISICLALGSLCQAVSSKVVRHSSSSDLLKGKVKNAVISSRGTIQLGRAAEAMSADFEGFADVWSINSIVADGSTIYFGTSPNGGIYRYASGKLMKIYPIEETEDEPKAESEPEPDPEEEQTAIEKLVQEIIEAEKYLSNEHIFAMATDTSGRLLAGISGKECKLCRFEDDELEVIFEPNDAKYIFAIAVDSDGNIFLGAGPEGKIYKLDHRGNKKGRVVYDSRDKNIMSLAIGRDGSIYAGTDGRGLVYKIDSETEEATVVYDSEQPEITALLPVGDSQSDAALYAAATSAKIVQTQTQFA
ncbi:MAG: PQQ-like beta-propeller repeat protein, partial [Phycisphaerales bacterium]